MNNNTYPAWICHDCGSAYGRPRATGSSTFHSGDACGWCGRDDVIVTEPRDYGYPLHRRHKSKTDDT